MGGTRIFELGGSKGARQRAKKKLLLSDFQLRKTSSRCFGRLRPEIKRNSTFTVQCFDTFRGFLHKPYAATMDRKGREGTYNFLSRRLGAAGGRYKAQGQLPPCHPAGAAHGCLRAMPAAGAER